MLKGPGRDPAKDSNLDEIDDSRLGQVGPDEQETQGMGVCSCCFLKHGEVAMLTREVLP